MGVRRGSGGCSWVSGNGEGDKRVGPAIRPVHRTLPDVTQRANPSSSPNQGGVKGSRSQLIVTRMGRAGTSRRLAKCPQFVKSFSIPIRDNRALYSHLGLYYDVRLC